MTDSPSLEEARDRCETCDRSLEGASARFCSDRCLRRAGQRPAVLAAIDAGVEWWCGALRAPSFDAGREAWFASGLATMCAVKSPPREDAIELFREALSSRLRERANWVLRESSCEFSIWLRVDYAPEGLLGEAAEVARVGMFPWKTSMTIDLYRVSVAEGYGSEDRTIWVSPELPAYDEQVVAALRYVYAAHRIGTDARRLEKEGKLSYKHEREGDAAILADRPSESAFLRAMEIGAVEVARLVDVDGSAMVDAKIDSGYLPTRLGAVYLEERKSPSTVVAEREASR